MLVACIGDSHFGARNDNPLFQEYFLDFFEKQFFPYLDEHNIRHIVHLGDVFDRRKYVNFNTLYQVRSRFFEPLAKRGIEMDVIIGNHDCYYKNRNDVNSPRELMALYPNVHVYDEPVIKRFDGLDVQFMPWINPANAIEAMEVLGASRCIMLMGHLEVCGFQMYRGIINEHGLDAKVFNRFKLVTSGHFHHKSTTHPIHYLGAPYEMTFSDLDDPRGFHIFDTDNLGLHFIRNSDRMFYHEIYNDKGIEAAEILGRDLEKFKSRYVKLVVTNKTNPYIFEKFLEKLMAVNPADISISDETILAVPGEMAQADANVNPDTLSILHNYVDGLDKTLSEHISRDRIKTILNELLAGAMAGEQDNMGEAE